MGQNISDLNYVLTGEPSSGGATGGFANPTTVDPVTKERSYSASAYFTPEGRGQKSLDTEITPCRGINSY